jgi:hypothetical protein
VAPYRVRAGLLVPVSLKPIQWLAFATRFSRTAKRMVRSRGRARVLVAVVVEVADGEAAAEVLAW